MPPDTPPRSDQKEAATMMRRPSPVSLPYFLTAVVAVLMASFLLGAAETVLPSAGHPVIVLVEGTPDRNVSAVDSWMSTYSQRQHVAVGRWQADLNNPESSRGLYLVSAADGTLNPFPKGLPESVIANDHPYRPHGSRSVHRSQRRVPRLRQRRRCHHIRLRNECIGVSLLGTRPGEPGTRCQP